MAPFFVLEEFEQYLSTEKRFSEHTLVAYKTDLNQFLDFTAIQSWEEAAEISHQVVRGWIVDLVDKDISKRSVNRKLSTLRVFFRWAQKQGVLHYNPMLRIQGPKQEKRLPTFAKQSELQPGRLDPLFTDNFDGVRDRLILEMFYQTGIRLSELLELKTSNVNAATIKVLGKRNKERLIPVTAGLQQYMEKYLQLKQAAGLESDCFFVLNNGNKLYPKFVYRKINTYLGEVTSLDKKSPHVLRHTFATHMLNNGAGLEALKDILGHANLSATQVYTHNSFAQLTSIYSQAHPRGHKKN
jgi:integrase/recombinase XerC